MATAYYLKDKRDNKNIDVYDNNSLSEAIETAVFVLGGNANDYIPRFPADEIKYICYETNEIKTESEWFDYYQLKIDHTEYADFCDWWHDMMKMDLLSKVN